MNRRKTLKNLMLASVGLVSLPAWAKGWSSEQIVIPQLFITEEQEVLAAVVDTIIPEGDNIGALLVGIDKYLQRLMADCYEPEIQENVRFQLNSLTESAEMIYNKTFVTCNQFERQTILLPRSTSEDIAQKDFFDLMKNETIRGFRTSKEVMMKYYDYKVAPGHYYGCVELNIV